MAFLFQKGIQFKFMGTIYLVIKRQFLFQKKIQIKLIGINYLIMNFIQILFQNRNAINICRQIYTVHCFQKYIHVLYVHIHIHAIWYCLVRREFYVYQTVYFSKSPLCLLPYFSVVNSSTFSPSLSLLLKVRCKTRILLIDFVSKNCARFWKMYQ